jgi:hypothetical protein
MSKIVLLMPGKLSSSGSLPATFWIFSISSSHVETSVVRPQSIYKRDVLDRPDHRKLIEHGGDGFVYGLDGSL